ncbi:hypothetical protein CF68_02820 [Cupriavidus sp. SK-4]|nr:hypothetical protein CF68_02820 [Cupriavidus sp. SK-4]
MALQGKDAQLQPATYSIRGVGTMSAFGMRNAVDKHAGAEQAAGAADTAATGHVARQLMVSVRRYPSAGDALTLEEEAKQVRSSRTGLRYVR